MRRAFALHGGAVHPNGTNFRRASKLDIVARMRRLEATNMLKEGRPSWLELCERVPPMELHSLQVQSRKIRSPYPQMIKFLLAKYPDLRFQDCYVDGNEWGVGMDAYRNDHPVMQFVGKQLSLMNTGSSKKDAFKETEKYFYERRIRKESEHKVMLAMALEHGVQPMFTSGKAYLDNEIAKAELEHLNRIRRRLSDLKGEAQRKQATEVAETGQERPSKPTLRVRQQEERQRLGEQARLRMLAVPLPKDPSPKQMHELPLSDADLESMAAPDVSDIPPDDLDVPLDSLKAPADNVDAEVRTSDSLDREDVVQARPGHQDLSLVIMPRQVSGTARKTKHIRDVGRMIGDNRTLGEGHDDIDAGRGRRRRATTEDLDREDDLDDLDDLDPPGGRKR